MDNIRTQFTKDETATWGIVNFTDYIDGGEAKGKAPCILTMQSFPQSGSGSIWNNGIGQYCSTSAHEAPTFISAVTFSQT